MVYKFELIGAVFILFMIYLSYIEYKKRNLSKLEFGLWLFTWFTSIILIFFRSKIMVLLKPLNIPRIFDLYTILAFMFLFVLIFFLYTRNKKTEKRVEEITRVVALKDLKEK